MRASRVPTVSVPPTAMTPPHAVDHRGGQRRDEGERDEEDRAVDRDAHADVTHLRGTDGVLLVLDGGRPNSLTSRAPATLKRSVIRVPRSAFCTICSWARLASGAP